MVGVGYLDDNPVSGMTYSCIFSIGDISLPPFTGTTLITVLDLATTTKTTDIIAVNIEVYLGDFK